MNLPFISACCKTYGRVSHLEETLFSFLNQAYRGQKQLVIYNDFPRQFLVFDHPEVKIVNALERSSSLGDGRNKCIKSADGEVILAMDDDDIYLPRHLEVMSGILGEDDYARFVGYFCANKWKIDSRVNGNGNFISHTKEAWRRVGGYTQINSGEDIDFSSKLVQAGLRGRIHEIPMDDTTFIYCWSNGVYHVSGGGQDQAGMPTSHQRMEGVVNKKADRGEIPTGQIKLKPCWRANWSQQAEELKEKYATRIAA